jgi:hypothetical protein
MLAVDVASLSFWDENLRRQVVHQGRYRFEAGPDSSSIAASREVSVTGTLTARVRHVTVRPDQVVFAPGETLDLTGKNPWIAPDTDQALEQPHPAADGIVEAARNDQSFADLSQATVGYRSSNRLVATVTAAGVVTAAATGVATIGVTVDGVSGSAVIVVRQPFALTGPAILTPGAAAVITTTLPNGGASILRDVELALTPPSGWTAAAGSPTSFGTVRPGHSATTTWHVTPTADAAPGSYPLTAQATLTGLTGRVTVDAAAQVSVPYASLPLAYGNPGISSDADPKAGNLDGGGRSYSAQALAAAGLTPGASVTYGGVACTWPDTQPGAADNVVAGGQVIALPGSGQTLAILGTGCTGTASGTLTVTFTDGSSQSFPLALADWWANSPAAGSGILATLPYINTASGRQTRNVAVYGATLPLPAGQTVAYVTLPDVSAGVVSGQNNMHIFALATG